MYKISIKISSICFEKVPKSIYNIPGKFPFISEFNDRGVLFKFSGTEVIPFSRSNPLTQGGECFALLW